MNSATKKVVMASMIAALCCVATMIIKIPSPMKGYLNLGDCVVLLSGFLFSPVYGFLAAGVGSALADLLSGYVIYAPATFVIKGVMALIAHHGLKLMQNRTGGVAAKIISGTIAEAAMVLGYFVFEGFLYGFIPSAVNIPANIIQGTAGLFLGIILTGIFERHKLL